MAQHRYESKKGSIGLGAAIRKYGWENFSVEVIETCLIEQLGEREIFWIATLKSRSPHGYNLTDGGDGGNGNKGKPFSKEHKAKISAAKKGKKRKPFSKEHKTKISAKLKGIKRSPETRARMSIAQKLVGNKPPSQKGKKRTPEQCAKISASNKGKKKKSHSPNKGVPKSPEHKAKISASVKATLAKKKLESQKNK